MLYRVRRVRRKQYNSKSMGEVSCEGVRGESNVKKDYIGKSGSVKRN